MEGLVHPQAEEMVLPSGLQLWVLGESPPCWHCLVSQPLGPTCSCSESSGGNGKGCSWELWGLRWALCSCGTFSLGVTNQRMFSWGRHLSKLFYLSSDLLLQPSNLPF